MDLDSLFSGIYKNKTVLITGHTGFKGSWLALWLSQMGANVVGYSLEAPTNPNHITVLNLPIESINGNILDQEDFTKTLDQYKPEIIFHLAAQSLVSTSYEAPIETLDTNVMGVAKVLYSCVNSPFVKAFVNVTSDKCYKNKGWVWGYREDDELGGSDPYSVSKGCSELITQMFRDSLIEFVRPDKEHKLYIASARAGNVVGGGDWAADRLIPDLIRSVEVETKTHVRNPNSVRPWQHVLEPLSGYLLLGQKLLEGEDSVTGNWNFGPMENLSFTVEKAIKISQNYWNKIDYLINENSRFKESRVLRLDSSKAACNLKWESVWSTDQAIKHAICWYRSFYENGYVQSLSDLDKYVSDARAKSVVWI